MLGSGEGASSPSHHVTKDGRGGGGARGRGYGGEGEGEEAIEESNDGGMAEDTGLLAEGAARLLLKLTFEEGAEPPAPLAGEQASKSLGWRQYWA